MESIIDKLEARECEMADELKKTPYTAPEYRTIAENLKTVSENKDKQIRTENDRLNNNEKNDIERMRVEVEMEKVRTERMKIGAGVLQDIGDLGKCLGFAWISYNGDKISFAIKEVIGIARGFLRSRKH